MVATPGWFCPTSGETRFSESRLRASAHAASKRATLNRVDAETLPVAAELPGTIGKSGPERGRARRRAPHFAAHHGPWSAPLHQVRTQRDLGARRGHAARRSVQLRYVRIQLADVAARFGGGQAALLAFRAKHELHSARVPRTGKITGCVRARADSGRAGEPARRAARERTPRAPLLPVR